MNKYRKMMEGIQRKLMIRTSSIPKDLLVKERVLTHKGKKQLRVKTITEWQERWERLSGKAHWTKVLINDMSAWAHEDDGESLIMMVSFLGYRICGVLYKFCPSKLKVKIIEFKKMKLQVS